MAALLLDNLDTNYTGDFTSTTGIVVKQFKRRGVNYSFTSTLPIGTTYIKVPTSVSVISGIFSTFKPTGTGTLIFSYCADDPELLEGDIANLVFVPSSLGSIAVQSSLVLSHKISGIKIVTTGCTWIVNHYM